MKNIAQIKVINNALGKERDKFMSELVKVNAYLENKMATLKKFTDLREYAESESFSLSRSVPALSRNMNSFSQRLQEIILAEEKEVEKLVKLKNEKIKNIEEVDRKMKAMDHFEATAVAEQREKFEKTEQSSIDELNSIKHTRGDYE